MPKVNTDIINLMLKLKNNEIRLLLLLLLLSLIPSIGGLLRLLELADISQLMPANPRVREAPLPVLLHIPSAVFFCIGGAIQFLPSVRQNHPKIHRMLGKALMNSGLILAGTGLYMSHFYNFPDKLQGELLYIVRLIVSTCLIVFILIGYKAIIEAKFRQHAHWMIRAYALAQGAGMQAVLTLPFLLVSGSEPLGLARDLIMIMGWTVNCIIAEICIRHYQRKWPQQKAPD